MSEPKIALLSNVNMDYVIRMLGRHVDIFRAEGYGNELGVLLNPASAYHEFGPDITFLVMDLMELLEHDLETESARRRIHRWFAEFAGGLDPEKIYYVSDAYLWGTELAVLADPGRKAVLEGLWQKELEEIHSENVRILPLRRLIEALGE